MLFDKSDVKEFILDIKNEVFLRYGENAYSLPILTKLLSATSISLEEADRYQEAINYLGSRRVSSNIFSLDPCFFKEDFNEFEVMFNKSLKLIKRVFPDLYECISVIDPLVCKTTEVENFESSSSMDAFGVIKFNFKNHGVEKWAEVISHEIAHHLLNIRMLYVEYSEVELSFFEEKRYSHIKKMNRPNIGVLHGAFAQAVMLDLYLRIQNSSEQKVVKENSKKTYECYLESFLEDYVIVKDAIVSNKFPDESEYILSIYKKVSKC